MERLEALEKIQNNNEQDIVLALAALGRIGNISDLPHIIPFISESSFEIRHIAAGVASSIIRMHLLERDEILSDTIRNRVSSTLSHTAPSLVLKFGKDFSHIASEREENAIRLLRHLECTPPVKSMYSKLLPCLQLNYTDLSDVEKAHNQGKTKELIMRWIDTKDSRLKANAIEVVEKLKDDSFLPLLTELKRDNNNRIRANALKAIHQMKDEDIYDELIEMLDAPPVNMKTSALWVISTMTETSQQVYNRVSKLLYHNNFNVVNNAIRALRNKKTHT